MVTARRLRDAARDERPRVRLVGVPRRHRPVQRLGGNGHPCARLSAAEPLLDRDRSARDRRRRAGAHPGDRISLPGGRADQELRRVPRLLAAALLQQRGRGRRVLGLPREAGGDGPLAAAQVGGARARRRDVDAVGRDPQHPQAVGRPGRLHRALQRDRRDDRRRDCVPARSGQLPLHRRRRVRRDLDAPGRRRARAQGEHQAEHRPAAQRRRPGTAEPRGAGRDRLDAAVAAGVRRAEVVPLLRRPTRRPQGDPGDRLPHRLQRRARLRGVLPSVRRRGGVGRDLEGRRAARDAAARARGARPAADRGRADLRRLRVRRPGRPVRGGDRLHGRVGRRGLRRPRRPAGAQRPPPAQAGRSGNRFARGLSGTATRSTSTGAGSA